MGKTISIRFSRKPSDQKAAREILDAFRTGTKKRMKARKKESFKLEEQARDSALEKVAGAHRSLVHKANDIARKIAKAEGKVSSPQVWQVLWQMATHDEGLHEELKKADPRWMGAVFNRSHWHRLGWEAGGSHKRPVSIWQLQPELKL